MFIAKNGITIISFNTLRTYFALIYNPKMLRNFLLTRIRWMVPTTEEAYETTTLVHTDTVKYLHHLTLPNLPLAFGLLGFLGYKACSSYSYQAHDFRHDSISVRYI